MAWTIDTEFGNGMFRVNPDYGFDSGGNTDMLSMCGVGAVYRSEINKLNVELQCGINIAYISGSAYGPALIARRQSNGNFYYATAIFDNFSSGTRSVQIHRYTASTDTFNILSLTSTPSAAYPITIPVTEILLFKFRLYNNNLQASLHRASGELLTCTGVIDTAITTAGSVGIGSNLQDSSDKNHTFCDDFKVYELI